LRSEKRPLRAFKNAGYKLTELLDSDWADCLELTQALIERVKEECRKQSLDDYSQEKFDEIARCLDKVKEMRASGLKTCNTKDGYKLNSELTDDLEYVRMRWAALDGWLTEIKQKFSANPEARPEQKTAASK
jgi:hypothetical protein